MPRYYGGMQNPSGEIRNAFRESVQQFVDVVERISPDAWDKPGLGEWTIRELVAHVVGMIDGIAAYAGPPAPFGAESATAYYVQAMSTPRIHEQITERARERVSLLGDDPAKAARAIADRTLAAIEVLDDAVPMVTPFGTLRLVDYLPTRVLEVVIHTLDVAHIAEVSVEPTRNALAVTLALLGEIAVERGDGAIAMLALSGRRALPGGFNVLS